MSDCTEFRPLFPGATVAVRRVLSEIRDDSAASDLLYLERWEREPLPGAAAALRVTQIRRANPTLAAEIRAEIARGRPLTADERESLGAKTAIAN